MNNLHHWHDDDRDQRWKFFECINDAYGASSWLHPSPLTRPASRARGLYAKLREGRRRISVVNRTGLHAMDNGREMMSWSSGIKIVDPLENARYRLESARSSNDQLCVLLAIVEFIEAVSERSLHVASVSSVSRVNSK